LAWSERGVVSRASGRSDRQLEKALGAGEGVGSEVQIDGDQAVDHIFIEQCLCSKQCSARGVVEQSKLEIGHADIRHAVESQLSLIGERRGFGDVEAREQHGRAQREQCNNHHQSLAVHAASSPFATPRRASNRLAGDARVIGYSRRNESVVARGSAAEFQVILILVRLHANLGGPNSGVLPGAGLEGPSARIEANAGRLSRCVDDGGRHP
jgi:hypothetical protein